MIPGAKLKIFLAADAAGNMASFKNQLLNMGYTAVFSFSNTDACIKRLPLKPDLVILPAAPRSAEGRTLVKQILGFNRQIMVIFTGGLAEARLQAIVERAKRRKLYRIRRRQLSDKLFFYSGAFLLAPCLKRISGMFSAHPVQPVPGKGTGSWKWPFTAPAAQSLFVRLPAGR